MDSAYKAINWKILLLTVGMMPFALALRKTNGIELGVEGSLSPIFFRAASSAAPEPGNFASALAREISRLDTLPKIVFL